MAILNRREINEIDLENFHARVADEAECLAFGMTVETALRMSIEGSLVSFAMEVDGKLAALWGYTGSGMIGSTGSLWMLTTPVVENHKVMFCRVSQRIVRELLVIYPKLTAYVDSRYIDATKWLTWLGFNVSEEHENGFLVMEKVR